MNKQKQFRVIKQPPEKHDYVKCSVIICGLKKGKKRWTASYFNKCHQ